MRQMPIPSGSGLQSMTVLEAGPVMVYGFFQFHLSQLPPEFFIT